MTSAGFGSAGFGTVRWAGAPTSDAEPVNPQFTATADGDLDLIVGATLTGPGLYRLVVVDLHGTRYCELANATISEVTWKLNDYGGLNFSVPITDLAANTYLRAIAKEVQLWRGDRLLWWGVAGSYRRNGDVIEWSCPELLWYFRRRYVGYVPLRNLLAAVDFSKTKPGSFPEGWLGRIRRPNATTGDVEIVTYPVSLGSISGSPQVAAVLTAIDSANNVNTQEVYFTTSLSVTGGIFGTKLDAYVSAKITDWPLDTDGSGNTSAKATLNDRLLWIGFYPAPGVTVTFGVTEDLPAGLSDYAPTFRDEDLNRGWFRVHTSIQIQPNISGTVEVRLYVPPGATIAFKDLVLNEDQSLDFQQAHAETIIAGLVEAAQDTTLGKSDLNIGTGMVGAASWALYDRRYLYSERPGVFDSFTEFSEMVGGVDYRVDVAPPSTRTLTTYYPYAGTRWQHVVLEVGRNCTLTGEEFDANVATTDLSVQSRRERSLDGRKTTDATDYGGTTLEYVFMAPLEARDPAAIAETCAREMNSPLVLTFTTWESTTGALVGVLRVGDFITCRVQDGRYNIDELRRIVSLRLRPESDALDVETRNAAAYP